MLVRVVTMTRVRTPDFPSPGGARAGRTLAVLLAAAGVLFIRKTDAFLRPQF
jgi:hypothetical protein